MNNRYMLRAGWVLLMAVASASAQDSAPQVEPTVTPPKAAVPAVVETSKPDREQPEPDPKSEAERETAETFVPTEDISEDRSVSFPVDI